MGHFNSFFSYIIFYIHILFKHNLKENITSVLLWNKVHITTKVFFIYRDVIHLFALILSQRNSHEFISPENIESAKIKENLIKRNHCQWWQSNLTWSYRQRPQPVGRKRWATWICWGKKRREIWIYICGLLISVNWISQIFIQKQIWMSLRIPQIQYGLKINESLLNITWRETEKNHVKWNKIKILSIYFTENVLPQCENWNFDTNH